MKRRLANRVLLIGWDGADWQMIRPLLAAGQMPNLDSLIRRGVSGNLATIQPVLSPMLWTSIATGKRADKHGICGFLEPKPDRSGVRPVTSTSRRCKALWNVLTQAGLKSQVVSWFASHPAEPINGSIVTDRYVAQCAEMNGAKRFPEGTFHPASLENRLAELLVRVPDLDADALLPFVPRASEIDQNSDSRLFKLGSLIARTASVHAATMDRLKSCDDWDLTAAYYIAIDEFGHTFMPYHPPRIEGVSEEDAKIYRDVMVGCYRFHDMMLGAMLREVGPETTVVLVSDHGFKNDAHRPGHKGYENPVDWHRHFGMVCMAGPGVREGEALYGATVLDVTPTILTLLGLATGADMDGRVWLEALSEPVRPKQRPSWEDVEGDAGMHQEEVREDPIGAAEAIRQLVALGYIEAPSDDAETSVTQAIRDQKVNQAIAIANSQRAAEALPLWRELTDEHPDDFGFALQLALCLCHNLEFEEAIGVLDHLEAQQPRNVEILLQRARIHQHRGEHPELVDELLAKAEGLIADDPQLLNALGALLAGAGRPEDAERAFDRSLAVLDDNPAALAGLARSSYQRGDFARSAELALDAVSLTHYYPTAHYTLGKALRKLARDEEAIAAFSTCLTQGHVTHEVHTQLAELYRTSDPERAKQHSEAADALL